MSGLFIAKKCVRLPHLLRVSQGEVFQPAYNREDFILYSCERDVENCLAFKVSKLKPLVVPLLSVRQLHRKLLE